MIDVDRELVTPQSLRLEGVWQFLSVYSKLRGFQLIIIGCQLTFGTEIIFVV